MEWQDPRMIYEFIPGEKTYKNRTILTFDLEVLQKLWIPGKQVWQCANLRTPPTIRKIADFWNFFRVLERIFQSKNFLKNFEIF